MNNIIKKDRIDQKVEEIVRESIYAWLKANNEILYNLSEEKSDEFVKTVFDIIKSEKYKKERVNALFDIYEVLAKIEIDYEDNVVRNN
jgi:uncharacterized protein YfkK (UPF0435 family)